MWNPVLYVVELSNDFLVNLTIKVVLKINVEILISSINIINRMQLRIIKIVHYSILFCTE